jgi:hypothetical protein
MMTDRVLIINEDFSIVLQFLKKSWYIFDNYDKESTKYILFAIAKLGINKNTANLI